MPRTPSAERATTSTTRLEEDRDSLRVLHSNECNACPQTSTTRLEEDRDSFSDRRRLRPHSIHAPPTNFPPQKIPHLSIEPSVFKSGSSISGHTEHDPRYNSMSTSTRNSFTPFHLNHSAQNLATSIEQNSLSTSLPHNSSNSDKNSIAPPHSSQSTQQRRGIYLGDVNIDSIDELTDSNPAGTFEHSSVGSSALESQPLRPTPLGSGASYSRPTPSGSGASYSRPNPPGSSASYSSSDGSVVTTRIIDQDGCRTSRHSSRPAPSLRRRASLHGASSHSARLSTPLTGAEVHAARIQL